MQVFLPSRLGNNCRNKPRTSLWGWKDNGKTKSTENSMKIFIQMKPGSISYFLAPFCGVDGQEPINTERKQETSKSSRRERLHKGAMQTGLGPYDEIHSRFPHYPDAKEGKVYYRS